MKKTFFISLLFLAFLSLSFCSGLFSIMGLTKLYASGGMLIIGMALILEVSKVITMSALSQFWNKINFFLKFFLLICSFILIFITSIGVYGKLIGSYKETSSNMKISDKKIALIELKRKRFTENIKDIQNELQIVKQDISNKNTSLLKTQDVDEKTIWVKNKFTTDIRKEINNLTSYRDKLSLKYEILSDSVSKLDIEILGLEKNDKNKLELGPLIFISDITSLSMDKVVNYLSLLIVIVLDPLAICILLVINSLIRINKKDDDEYNDKLKKPEETIIPKIEPIKTDISETEIKNDGVNNVVKSEIIPEIIQEPIETQPNVVESFWMNDKIEDKEEIKPSEPLLEPDTNIIVSEPETRKSDINNKSKLIIR